MSSADGCSGNEDLDPSTPLAPANRALESNTLVLCGAVVTTADTPFGCR